MKKRPEARAIQQARMDIRHIGVLTEDSTVWLRNLGIDPLIVEAQLMEEHEDHDYDT